MPSLLQRLPPSILALLLQLAAFILTVLSARLLDLHPAPLLLALLCGCIAAAFSRIAGLARWWLLIQLLFAPAAVLTQALNIPSGVFLAAFLGMLAVYWSTFRTQVPLYLSSNKVWLALESQLPPPATTGEKKSGFKFIDLGSGLGGVLTHLAKVRPDGQYSGVESAPLPFLWSWLRTRGYRNCEVRWCSLWNNNLEICNLAQYDVVFAYLSPAPMQQLWHKARAEMHPGSLFISSTFAVPDQVAHQTLQIDDLHQSALLIWRM